jgi:NAD(P)-dependent dehydrogenase (short-subunit alcohol dehydrogenase family)
LGTREGRGTIVNVASMYGLVGCSPAIPSAAYTASKHAVVGLTKHDGIHYAPEGIRINAICPGYVATPLLLSATSSGAMDAEIKKVPMGRLADMEEIADAIVFLSSPMASFMCGTGMVVDG